MRLYHIQPKQYIEIMNYDVDREAVVVGAAPVLTTGRLDWTAGLASIPVMYILGAGRASKILTAGLCCVGAAIGGAAMGSGFTKK